MWFERYGEKRSLWCWRWSDIRVDYFHAAGAVRDIECGIG
jgi:hypothetical protein